MMKRIIIILLCVMTLGSLYADIPFLEKGFYHIEKIEEDDVLSFSMEDEMGHSIRLAVAKGVSEEEIASFFTLHALIKRWSIINYSSITFLIDSSTISFTIHPIHITYKDVDVLQYLPSSLYFSQIGELLAYDFRMNIGATMPKIQGRYDGEIALLESMLAAIVASKEEEEAFNNDNYQLLEYKITNLEKQVEFLDTHKALKGEVELLNKTLEQEMREREKEYNGLVGKIGELRNDVAALTSALAVGTQTIERLQEEQSSLYNDLFSLKKAIITLHNVGVFGNIRSIDPTIIDRILILKSNNPDITQQEMKRILMRDKFEPTEHELFLIFSLFFNEYQ